MIISQGLREFSQKGRNILKITGIFKKLREFLKEYGNFHKKAGIF